MTTISNHPNYPYQHNISKQDMQVIFKSTPGRKPENAATFHGHQSPESSVPMHSSSRPGSIMSTISIENEQFNIPTTLHGPGGFAQFSPEAVSIPNMRTVDNSNQCSHRHSISTIGAGTVNAPYRNLSVSSNNSGISTSSHPGQGLTRHSLEQNSFQPFHQLICAFCKTPLSATANYHECLDCAFFKHTTIFCPTCFAMSPKHAKHHHDRSKFVASWDPVIQEPSWQITGWEVRKTIMGLVWYHHQETRYKTFQRPAPPVDLFCAQTVPASAASYETSKQQHSFPDVRAQHIQSPKTSSKLHPSRSIDQTQQVDAQLPLPPGWREMMTPDDKIYYRNETTHETSWTKPIQERQLVQGWEPRLDPDGRVFYFNSKTQQATWDRPAIGASFSIPGSRPKDPSARKFSSPSIQQVSTALQKVPIPNSTQISAATNTVKEVTKKSALGMKSAAKNFKNNKKAHKFVANVGVGLVGGLVKEAIGIGGCDGGAEVLAAVGMGVANAALKTGNPGMGVGTAVMGLMDGNDANDGAILAKMAMQVAQGIVDQKFDTRTDTGLQRHDMNGVSRVGPINVGQPGLVQGQQSTGAAVSAEANINVEALAAAILEIAALQKTTAAQTSHPRQGGTSKRRTKVIGVGKPSETTDTANEMQPLTVVQTVPYTKPKKNEKPVSAETPDTVAPIPIIATPLDSQHVFQVGQISSLAVPEVLQEDTLQEINQTASSIAVSALDPFGHHAKPAKDTPRSAASNAPIEDPVKTKKGRRPVPSKPQIPNLSQPGVPPTLYPRTQVLLSEFPSTQGPLHDQQIHSPQLQGGRHQAHRMNNASQVHPSIQHTTLVPNLPCASDAADTTSKLSQYYAPTSAGINPNSQMLSVPGPQISYSPQAYIIEQDHENVSTDSQQTAYHQHASNPPYAQQYLPHQSHQTHPHQQHLQPSLTTGGDEEYHDPTNGDGPLHQTIDQCDLSTAQQEDEEEEGESDNSSDDDDDDGGVGDDKMEMDADDDNETGLTNAEHEVDEEDEEEDEDGCDEDSFEQITSDVSDIADFQHAGHRGESFSMQAADVMSIYSENTVVQTETDVVFYTTSNPGAGTDSTFPQIMSFEPESYSTTNTSADTTAGSSDDISWTGGMGFGMDGFYGSYASSDTRDCGDGGYGGDW